MPYPCCCGNCEIGADTFDRADDADPGTNWDTSLGSTAEIVGNKLVFTAANEILPFDTVSPDGTFILSFLLYGDSGGDWKAHVGAYKDANNYYYAVIRRPLSLAWQVLELITVIGGVSSTRITVTYFHAPVNVYTVCLSENTFSVQALPITNQEGAAVSVPMPGTGWRPFLGTGSSVGAGTVDFDTFSATKGYSLDGPSCPICLSLCSSICFDADYRDIEFDVQVDGYANTAVPTCTQCALLNDLVRMKFWEKDADNRCWYRYLYPSAVDYCDGGGSSPSIYGRALRVTKTGSTINLAIFAIMVVTDTWSTSTVNAGETSFNTTTLDCTGVTPQVVSIGAPTPGAKFPDTLGGTPCDGSPGRTVYVNVVPPP